MRKLDRTSHGMLIRAIVYDEERRVCVKLVASLSYSRLRELLLDKIAKLVASVIL